MSFHDLLTAAYSADPIACWIAGVAAVLIAAAVPFRRGGVDARFIIQVFAILATIGTVPRIILWAGEIAANSPNPPRLSGTDLLLAAGGMTAILWSSAQELLAVFVGKREDPPLAVRWWRRLGARTAAKIPAWLKREKDGEEIEETSEAAALRQKLDPTGPPAPREQEPRERLSDEPI